MHWQVLKKAVIHLKAVICFSGLQSAVLVRYACSLVVFIISTLFWMTRAEI